jgi:uncharacterized protein YfaS (alpha-2-macroglobulin family)
VREDKVIIMRSHFVTKLFGQINWTSPPWIRFLRTQAKHKPALFWGSFLAIILVLASVICTTIWYINRPLPLLISTNIKTPKITPLSKPLVPDTLEINFGLKTKEFQPKAVAPLALVGKEVIQGIELVPNLPGKWVWETDSKLVFTPEEDWPAGQKYKIYFAKNFFANSSKIDSLTKEFSTLPFKAHISKFVFHQDPSNSKNKEVIATIRFNFPVDAASLKSLTSLDTAKFRLEFDQFMRTAYVHSEINALPKQPQFMHLVIEKGVKSATGSGQTDARLEKKVLVPDFSSFFKIIKADASIVRDNQDRPEQVLHIETTDGVKDPDINKALRVYILPKNYPASSTEPEKTDYQWQNPGEVNANILALSSPLSMKALPSDRNFSTLHSYKFKAKGDTYLYIKLEKGLPSFGGFELSTDYVAIIKVPELPKEISFLHKGALLALAGEKQVSMTIRGLSAVKFQVARVLPDNVNQLVTQAEGDFNNPYFVNQRFDQQNISELFSEIRTFDASDLSKRQYTALDLGKYLSTKKNTGGPQGLFLLQATGWDLEKKEPLNVKTNRLILVTDLGLLVKDNLDGTHDVFLQSITQGKPVANANIAVLGKNGLPIATSTTDQQGRVTFPRLTDFIEDKEPTVYLAKLGDDVSFIPYKNNFNRELNYSRFDIGGLYTYTEDKNSLNAYIFSDRGIYRPGDTIHLGFIVKQIFARSALAGIPLEVTIMDSRGTTILDQKLALNETGFWDMNYKTNPTSPTGQYYISLFIVKDNQKQNMLGSTTVNIAEFQPDRMRIHASLSKQVKEGWVSPQDLMGKVQLMNLYGAPAVDRKVSGKILLAPKNISFEKYPDFIFTDPLRDPKKPATVFNENLEDQKTDDKGEAQFPLNLDRFDKGSYHLTFFAEGFEAEGGRSVTTQISTLVSPLQYFIGYKPDGDLGYIKQNDIRSVKIIAINSHIQQQALEGLSWKLLSLHPVTTLVKNNNGSYQYKSIIKASLVKKENLSIGVQGIDFKIPSQDIGDFELQILDKDNTPLNHFKFSIVGASQKTLTKNAELSVKLNKEKFLAGEEIELQIVAPFTGSGLITIERDKVYAAQWFTSNTTNSLQKIVIPADFQGNGYVNVAFVRNWDSPEIYISPLSYSVVPFEVSHEAHALNIDLSVPDLARPGEDLNITYKTDKPAKILIFAVDEGILQVASFITPDPLHFFFQKRALEVLTQQTLDQILPKFVKERELSATGGDAAAALLKAHLNPFKRKTDLAVAFWSGILDSDGTSRQTTFLVPDYFNGTLRVMAVAVSSNELGSVDTKAKILGNFVINPNVPTFVAPGDEFEISASIANNVQNSGANAQIKIQLEVPAELDLIGNKEQTLVIPENQEKTVQYRLKAKSMLGSTNLRFLASLNEKSSSMNTSLSIRPATNRVTTVNSGMTKEESKTLSVDRILYPEYSLRNLSLSNSPLILMMGLKQYLDNFPYGCTEQLTSKAWPLLAMANQPGFSKDAQKIQERITAVFQMLAQRQMSNGGFSYWPGLLDNDLNSFITVYALHFLTEAKNLGYSVPNDMVYYGMEYLKHLASQNNSEISKARIQAYAIYLLTRNEIVTTNYLTNLQANLTQAYKNNWEQDIAGAYIAATYQLLKNYAEADRLINAYKKLIDSNDPFYSPAVSNAQYLYLIAKHFPNQIDKAADKFLLSLVEAVNSEQMNTILSGFTSMALGAYAEHEKIKAYAPLSVTEIDKNNAKIGMVNKALEKLKLNEATKQVLIHNPEKQNYFYQLTQTGFDKNLPDKSITQGMEIVREYRDKQGNAINTVSLGDEIEVHIQIRTTDKAYINNIAILDLLPGGFEVVRNSINSVTDMDYIDAREDRVIFFGSIGEETKQIVYKIKATNSGAFTVPAPFAESMYNPQIKANGTSSNIKVSSFK